MKKETSQSPGSAQDRKMSKGELISYGLGGVASTMPSQFKTSYAMNFMSDVAGLHVGAVGVLNTLLIIWDAINDPIIGGIADRTNTKRFGKYRPHMIMGVLLWAVIMVMLFTVPSLPETGMWIYYIIALRAVICAALLLGTVTLVNTTSSAISLYYLRCVVENVALKSIFSIVSLLISLIFIPMMPAVLKKVGKIKTVLYGMALIVLPAIWLMIRRESMSDLEVVASSFFSSFGFVCANVAALSMIPDCTDYTEYKFGTSQAGFINASITFMKKFCSSFSTTIVGVALAAVGYSADSVSQEVIDMIINIKIIYPFILLIVTGLILHFYPITPEFARKMRAELKERRTAAAAAKQA